MFIFKHILSLHKSSQHGADAMFRNDAVWLVIVLYQAIVWWFFSFGWLTWALAFLIVVELGLWYRIIKSRRGKQNGT